MTYYVENWDSEEIIAEFKTEEERNTWLKENTCESNEGFVLKSDPKVRVSIYEMKTIKPPK